MKEGGRDDRMMITKCGKPGANVTCTLVKCKNCGCNVDDAWYKYAKDNRLKYDERGDWQCCAEPHHYNVTGRSAWADKAGHIDHMLWLMMERDRWAAKGTACHIKWNESKTMAHLRYGEKKAEKAAEVVTEEEVV